MRNHVAFAVAVAAACAAARGVCADTSVTYKDMGGGPCANSNNDPVNYAVKNFVPGGSNGCEQLCTTKPECVGYGTNPSFANACFMYGTRLKQYFSSSGWSVFRLWSDDITDDTIEGVLDFDLTRRCFRKQVSITTPVAPPAATASTKRPVGAPVAPVQAAGAVPASAPGPAAAAFVAAPVDVPALVPALVPAAAPVETGEGTGGLDAGDAAAIAAAAVASLLLGAAVLNHKKISAYVRRAKARVPVVKPVVKSAGSMLL